MKEFFKEWAELLIAEAGIILLGLYVLAPVGIPLVAVILAVAAWSKP